MSNIGFNAAGAAPRYASARRHQRPGLFIVAVAILLSLLALLPLGFVISVAFETGWPTVKALVFRPRVAELLLNTLLLVVFTLPICAVLGVALAWLTERTTLPGRRIWSLLATAPLAVPAFVQSYAWISLVPSMHGLGAGVFISVIAYFPFIYLPAAAVLRRLDPGIEDVATSLGTRPLAVFFRVVLPQLKLAIWGGSLLIALHLLAEYGLYAMIRFDTFTTAIFDQFQSTFNGPAANMLAGVLVLCCLVLLLLEAGSRGRARYARVGSGSARSQNAYRLGPAATLFGLLLPLVLTALALGVPFITLARWLTLGGFEVWRNAELLPALLQTLSLAASGALLITLCAIPMAWLSVRYPARLYRILEGCNYVTSSLPGIVVALALVTITIHS
ncbi:MAG: ABC transporter permease subunit, partial [Serratia liquefaciens]|nr:ABC transporter permease subunit [Serratia liquefaciens]